MSEHVLVGLAAILILGIAAQWLAWRLHLPSILLLLIAGFAAGPISGLLDPDAVFGEVLFPLVSLSVAVILFEGGLSLRFSELKKTGRVVTMMITVGSAVTWILAAYTAWAFAGLSLPVSILLGAILVVTGPTVIVPLLAQVRPAGRVGSIIKWEGIVNDPIGAMLAVVVFEVILAGGLAQGGSLVLPAVLKSVGYGTLVGLVGAALIVIPLRRYWIPDVLQSPVSLMMVILAYLVSDLLQTESGLFAVTVMGIALANQRFVSIRHILEFKENLRVLLIASLFIILAARVPVNELLFSDPRGWLFVIVLIAIVRPAAVFASTIGSDLKFNEKLFISAMAPRGIVAAAVSAVFALRLVEAGFDEFASLTPITFQVIIGTVAFYGLAASPIARRLKLSQANPQGVLIAGAHEWGRSIGVALKDRGYNVAMVDSNWANVTAARHLGIRAYYGSILSEELLFELQLDGIGKLMALTPNDEVNSLAALHFIELFGREGVYQLPPSGLEKDDKKNSMPRHLRGRFLFDRHATFEYLRGRFRDGATIKRTTLSQEFPFEKLRQMYGEQTLHLFILGDNGKLSVNTVESKRTPKPGETVLSVVDPVEENGAG